MAILKSAPAGAQVLDLGAARVARAEARQGQPLPVIKLGAGFVQVSPEMDVLSADDFAAGRIREGLSKLLADPTDVDELVKGGVSKDDLEAIVQFVTGVSLGE